MRCFLIAFHYFHESHIFPSPFLKPRQMGSEVISRRRLKSLNCILACLCIPKRGVAIIGPNGNRCRVPRDVASGARRAAWQASDFAGNHLQHFIQNSLAETLSEIPPWGEALHCHLRVKVQELPLWNLGRLHTEHYLWKAGGDAKQFSDKDQNSGCKCLGDRKRCHAKPGGCYGNCNWKSLCSWV